MAKSQLKRLKESLRSAGVTGQQKPKKAKNRRQQSSDSRVDKNVALQSIREEFNPFEIKTTKEKFGIIGQKKVKGKEGRPGLSKQIGEDNRKKTLLVEMQRRNKSGGIIDRRFGENDPTMTPEERMLERFAKEKQKRVRGGDIFNLDDEDELTHLGQSLGGLKDDFDRGDAMDNDSDDGNGPTLEFRKRLLETEEDEEEEEGQPERKKSKAEVMKEVISKSKFHKYERQKAKEDDEEEREKLDAEMGSLWALLGQKQPSTTRPAGQEDVSGTNNEPLGVRGSAAKELEKEVEAGKNDEYDKAVREMMFDARSKPSDRTKTEEEQAAEESERLKKLEDERQRRMRGEDVSDKENDNDQANPDSIDDEDYRGDHAVWGLGEGLRPAINPKYADMNPDELVDGDYEVSEDGYVDVDEAGVVEGDMSDDYDSEASSIAGSAASGDDSDEEGFLAELLPGTKDGKSTTTTGDKLAFTFPCPQSHQEFLEITKSIPVDDLPTVVQRIRVLYHPKLAEENKVKLANFSTVLLAHILHLANTPNPPFPVIDTLTRHLHALAKTYPIPVSQFIREHVVILQSTRISNPTPADLVLLTAISAIFPTSDHFHQVVTPALIVIHQHLSQTPPASHRDLAIGAYLITLSIRYQSLSKRFSPEALNYVYQAIALLSPSPFAKLPGTFPYHSRDNLRIKSAEFKAALKSKTTPIDKLKFSSISTGSIPPITLLTTFLSLLSHLSNLWTGLPSHSELFTPAISLLKPLKPLSTPLLTSLSTIITNNLSNRPPLQLHHHRPLPIPSNYPAFDESYNPERHPSSRDPDPDRREAKKLKAEIKREKKGAVRELRKDAQFISREKMKKDKQESREYHEKMRKIIARVQTEEGAEGNRWEREKRKMKK
ncbi:Nop14-like protein [Ascodesmis nigricans]|uniref:Nop14-like protein n=1 Tax=Ascodesmis nigricans TaxID=341454 RepID=A0A4S2N2H4_9PEZI|nr:Nop14-like protein [Ascodesmis nigricans]